MVCLGAITALLVMETWTRAVTVEVHRHALVVTRLGRRVEIPWIDITSTEHWPLRHCMLVRSERGNVVVSRSMPHYLDFDTMFMDRIVPSAVGLTQAPPFEFRGRLTPAWWILVATAVAFVVGSMLPGVPATREARLLIALVGVAFLGVVAYVVPLQVRLGAEEIFVRYAVYSETHKRSDLVEYGLVEGMEGYALQMIFRTGSMKLEDRGCPVAPERLMEKVASFWPVGTGVYSEPE